MQVDFELVVELLKPVYTLSLKRSRNDFFHNIVSILRCLLQQIALIGMYGDIIEMTARDENGTDIFRSYSSPNPFRGVQICPYPSSDIHHPIPYPYPNTQIIYL